VNRYSVSKIKSYDMCKLKYKLNYIDKIWPEEEPTDDIIFGRLVHKAAEIYEPEKDNKKEIVKIVRDFPKLGKDYKRLIGSTYKSVIEFLKRHTNPAEKELHLNYAFENFTITGYVDRLIDNEKTYTCVDYKTSKNATLKWHIFQLKFYNLLISKKYNINPSKIKMMLYFPRPDQEEKKLFSKKEIDLFEEELKAKVVEIESNTNWEPEPGYHCKWCPFFEKKECSATYKEKQIIS